MTLLLDTHTLIWALEDNPKLTDEARDLITNINNTIYVSTASIWEIAIKSSKKNFPYDANEIVRLCSMVGFRFLGIGVSEFKNYWSLKLKPGFEYNNDPFDRILVCQAKTYEMQLLTHDHIIKGYDEECVISF